MMLVTDEISLANAICVAIEQVEIEQVKKSLNAHSFSRNFQLEKPIQLGNVESKLEKSNPT